MDIKEKISAIEEIMELDEGSLAEDTRLEDLDEWDSITRLSIMIFFEEELGKKVSADDIKGFETVKDICDRMD